MSSSSSTSRIKKPLAVKSSKQSVVSKSSSSNNDRNQSSWAFQLAKAWSNDFLPLSSVKAAAAAATTKEDDASLVIVQAMARTMPLLLESQGSSSSSSSCTDPTVAVPFVCRYRTDVIAPLETIQVHKLAEYLLKHKALESLRTKILHHLTEGDTKDVDTKNKIPLTQQEREQLVFRVETSISKSELEDLYAPFKPVSKGSLEERILQTHPELVDQVNRFWNEQVMTTPSAETSISKLNISTLQPTDAAVTLLANRIASHVETVDALMDFTRQVCRVKVTPGTATTKSASANKHADTDAAGKYKAYYNFEGNLQNLRDHQVLAIRRGVADNKALKLAFDMDDNERCEGKIRHVLQQYVKTGLGHFVWKEAMKDAWSRLLRKRCTSRVYKEKCQAAEEHAMQVFCDNLHAALLAPPPRPSPPPVLALDPGFAAGIKCALLTETGSLVQDVVSDDETKSLVTVHFTKNYNHGRDQMVQLLQSMHEYLQQKELQRQNTKAKTKSSKTADSPSTVVIALGNGHGSQEARKLVTDAATVSGIPIDIQTVNEAGASVWSVTESAKREFPNEPASAVAAVSIGRRYQNPLAELVKIPPRSLGLGMYQHDFAATELDAKLHRTSVAAVAAVGVDVNACSLEILQKVPALTTKLAERILQARPIHSRQELLQITGLGPKTFENCAAFVRVADGANPLDNTLCHPESYDLARHLLKQFGWKLQDKESLGKLPPKGHWSVEWKEVLEASAKKFGVTEERVLSVIDHLVTSITQPDPRISDASSTASAAARVSTNNCELLPDHLSSDPEKLAKACPVRNVIATVRNIVDFGAFVDFGGPSDGLLHRSKLGATTSLDSFMVGQTIGIDILGVSKTHHKVTVSLAGLNLPAENLDDVQQQQQNSQGRGRSTSNSRAKASAPERSSSNNNKKRQRPPAASKSAQRNEEAPARKRQKTKSKT